MFLHHPVPLGEDRHQRWVACDGSQSGPRIERCTAPSGLDEPDRNIEPLLQQLAEVVAMVDTSIVSMRRLATELRPHLLDDFGLLPAMESYFQEFIRRLDIAGEFTSQVNELELTGESATAYFRIFQESLTNIARHAEASQVTARLERSAEAVTLRVTDNGRGMRPEDRAARGHLGLTGMQERASMIGAALELISTPGSGTTVLLRMPFEPAS